jgi:hypothetical protein
MKLVIDGAAGLVTVDEPENLKALSVELHGCSPAQAGALLGDRDLGRIDGGHAWLHIRALHAIARQPRSCTWDERFQMAMTYAQRNGWTDPTGDFVRAHLEPTLGAAGAATASAPAGGTQAANAANADTPIASPPTSPRPATDRES